MTRSGSDWRALHPGHATGVVEVLDEPLSFWGGVDRKTGQIIDVHHPQHGRTVAGRILVMPAGRGSSSSSSVLAEILRNGTGPAGIVLGHVDLIISLGVMVAAELYGQCCPVVVGDDLAMAPLHTGDQMHLLVTPDGPDGDLSARLELISTAPTTSTEPPE